MAHQGKVSVGVRRKKQGGNSKSNHGRNESPSRKRYRERFFTGKLGRKAKKFLLRKGVE